MAHHIVDSVLPLTSISLSVAALFLDLEKAVDRAVREAVMGYPRTLAPIPSAGALISKMSVFLPWLFVKSCA